VHPGTRAEREGRWLWSFQDLSGLPFRPEPDFRGLVLHREASAGLQAGDAHGFGGIPNAYDVRQLRRAN
jgi:hypothetical protein